MTKENNPSSSENLEQKKPIHDIIETVRESFADTAKLTIARADQLNDALKKGEIGSFSASSPFAKCLLPLLQAIGWRGDIRSLFESLPHFANGLNLTEFRNTLANMNYRTTFTKIKISQIDERLLPALFVQKGSAPIIILSASKKGYKIYDSSDNSERTIKNTNIEGTAYFISSKYQGQTQKPETEMPPKNWIGDLVWRFKGSIYQLLALTFVLNITALIVPLFIMAIYDQVIPSKSYETLAFLTAGIIFAVSCEISLRVLRAKFIAYLGARVENIIANATLRKLLSLSPSMTESSPIGSQVSRLKEFDSIKGLFSGTLVNIIMELPFLLLFMAVISILGGIIAYVPVVLVLVFIIIGLVILPAMRRSVAQTGKSRSKKHSFLVETLSNLRVIKQAGAEKTWSARYREISADAAYGQFKTSQYTLFLQSIGQALMMAAGVATMGLGVLQVLDDKMTIGALIACMALVWRVLSPLQGLFLTLTRFEQTMLSVKQINQVMRLNPEKEPNPTNLTQRKHAGQVIFQNISYRYAPDKDPALMNLNFAVQPGEILGIMGNNAAGKSTVLKLLLAMYKPQGGQILLDGLDIRQINPQTIRQSIAYVPQKVDFFHGTISQNLLLAHPMATQDEIEEACKMANIYDEIMEFSDGFETRIGDQNVLSLASSFKQRISLARAYLKKAPILLLDEPAQTLDYEGDNAFMDSLNKLKGTCTIIMVSHRPSHLKMADKILIVENGAPRAFGTPEEIFPPQEGQRA
jgi:ATP-binding cassette subfamily C protein/ATP-binding cassette subfamily C protein LapB